MPTRRFEAHLRRLPSSSEGLSASFVKTRPSASTRRASSKARRGWVVKRIIVGFEAPRASDTCLLPTSNRCGSRGSTGAPIGPRQSEAARGGKQGCGQLGWSASRSNSLDGGAARNLLARQIETKGAGHDFGLEEALALG